MCYERRRAEACVDESAHHAPASRPAPLESKGREVPSASVSVDDAAVRQRGRSCSRGRDAILSLEDINLPTPRVH